MSEVTGGSEGVKGGWERGSKYAEPLVERHSAEQVLKAERSGTQPLLKL